MTPPAGAISLAQAARLSGYHQDYLGQLCRAGKLQATKIGRTWFTTERSVRDFLSALQGDSRFDFSEPEVEPQREIVEESVSVQPLPTPSMDAAGPQVAENYVISQVVGLPIALQERPQVAQLSRAASLDGVITKVRLQQVQRDLISLTEAVEELAAQVENNSKQIENLQVLGTGTMKNSYAPSLEFAVASAPTISQRNYFAEPVRRKNYTGKILIVSGSMLLIAFAFLLSTNSVWQSKFFGEPINTTLYHNAQPQVAGDSVIVPTALDQGSATVTNSNSNINNVPPAPSTPGETLGGIGAGQLLQ